MASIENIERLADEIAAERYPDVGALFPQRRGPPPFLLWQPQEADLPARPLVELWRWWSTLPRGGGLPMAGSLDADLDRASTDSIAVVELTPDRQDFVHRRLGGSSGARDIGTGRRRNPVRGRGPSRRAAQARAALCRLSDGRRTLGAGRDAGPAPGRTRGRAWPARRRHCCRNAVSEACRRGDGWRAGVRRDRLHTLWQRCRGRHARTGRLGPAGAADHRSASRAVHRWLAVSWWHLGHDRPRGRPAAGRWARASGRGLDRRDAAAWRGTVAGGHPARRFGL